MMFPLWLFGVVTYRLSQRSCLQRVTAIVLFAVSLGAIAVGEYLADGCGLVQRQFSSAFPPGFALFDYGLGVVLAANIFASCSLTLRFGRLAPIIRRSAGYSFSLYLYHLPLLYLSAALPPPTLPVSVRGTLMLATTIVAVVALGAVTETRKKTFHRVLARAADALGRLFRSNGPPAQPKMVGQAEPQP